MSERQVVLTLTRKQEEIERYIAELEKRLGQARADLAHVVATIHLYQIGDRTNFPAYADVTRLFRPKEIGKLCKDILAASAEPMTTRELALAVIRTKGWDEADIELRKAVGFRIVQALTMQWKRGKIVSPGKRGNVRLWTPP